MSWDGHRLPGPWLVVRALEQALARVPEYGIAAVAIRESHARATPARPAAACIPGS
jgi:LDH2 family malate/lactate/ureidoglycolate dehydrogenase